MAKDKLIYASAARKAILKEDPKLAYCIDAVPGVDAMGMDEKTYQRIMNRLFLAAESVCGNDMVDLETIGDVIREECGMDGGNEDG